MTMMKGYEHTGQENVKKHSEVSHEHYRYMDEYRNNRG